MVVGTAQLPGSPLPDGWSDPEVRESAPQDEIAGKATIPLLLAVVAGCARTLWRHLRVRRQAHAALTGLRDTPVAVLPDTEPYAYALPAGPRDRIVVSTAMLDRLDTQERRVLFAHERAHLTARHHRHLLITQLAAQANPFLLPLRTAASGTHLATAVHRRGPGTVERRGGRGPLRDVLGELGGDPAAPAARGDAVVGTAHAIAVYGQQDSDKFPARKPAHRRHVHRGDRTGHRSGGSR